MQLSSTEHTYALSQEDQSLGGPMFRVIYRLCTPVFDTDQASDQASPGFRELGAEAYCCMEKRACI